jgi:TP901 family phage tail tape measure protein
VPAASSLTFRLFGEDVSASRTLDKVGVEAEALGGKFTKVGAMAGKALAGITVAVGAVGAASVKMAMDFDQQMARLVTQAHVPQAELKQLSAGVLDLAGKVGIGPTSLAEALYHVESSFASTGITGARAMEILKVAAEGARIGGSNLVDTTNAMDAAVVSGIKGVENYSEAMGRLNATVGAGDMSMQDLADALGTGMLAVVKGFGVTLSDVSAGLATFGDNNMRGALAGNQLRMSVQALVKPAAAGDKMLRDMGLTAHKISVDMQQGGLNKALIDLKSHMDKAGVSGNKVGEWLTNAFGRKAGTGLNILIGQFDRFESKFEEADKGAKQFGQDWAVQQQQFSQVLKQLEAGAEAIGIKLGNFLIPKIMQFGKAVGDVWHTLNVNAGGQNSIFKELSTGFKMPDMTNFDSGFGGALERIGVAARNLLTDAGNLGTKLYQALLPAFKDLWKFITDSLWPALQNLWPIIRDLGAVYIAGLIVWWRGLASFLKDVVGPVLQHVTGWMKDNKTWVEAVTLSVTAMWGAWKGYTVVTSVIAGVKGLSAAFATLDATMAANPVGVVVVALAGMAVAVTELWIHWDQVWGWIEHHKAYAIVAAAIASIVLPFIPITVGLVALAKNWNTVWTGVEKLTLRVANGMVVAFKAVGDGMFSMVIGMLGAASHLPFGMGAPFAKAKKGLLELKDGFDSSTGGAIQDIHNLIWSMGAIPPVKRVTFTSNGTPDVVNDINRINTALGKIGDSYVVSVGGTGRKLINADGGHYAQIGNGVTRVWNEPETGGEAYIPLAPSKRGRSIDIWAQTGRSLGVFADGGIIGPTNVKVDTQQIGSTLLGNYGGSAMFSGGIGGGVQQFAGLVLQVLRMLGLSAGLVGKVLSQMTTESGGNATIVNRSDSNWFAGTPSVGLMQVIGPTFRAYAGPFAGLGPFEYGTSVNPLANIYAGLNYAAHRYGPNLNGLGQGHGYAMGGFARGWARVGEAGPEMVYLGRGGQVISNRDSSMGGGQVIVNLHGPVYSDSAGIKRLMTEIDREVAKGGSVPQTFRRN